MHSNYSGLVADVSIDILDELDLTHLRATGLQSNEEELPEAEQAPCAGNLSTVIHLGRLFKQLSWTLCLNEINIV